MKTEAQECRELEDAFMRELRKMSNVEMRRELRALVRKAAALGGERFLCWAQGGTPTDVELQPSAQRYCGDVDLGWLVTDYIKDAE